MYDQGYDSNRNDYEPVDLNRKKGSNGYAVASLVLGILTLFGGCCCCCDYVALALGVLAIVFAILSRKQDGGKMRGIAVAGLVCAIVGLVEYVSMKLADTFIPEDKIIDTYRSMLEKYGISPEEFDKIMAEYQK